MDRPSRNLRDVSEEETSAGTDRSYLNTPAFCFESESLTRDVRISSIIQDR